MTSLPIKDVTSRLIPLAPGKLTFFIAWVDYIMKWIEVGVVANIIVEIFFSFQLEEDHV